MEQNLIGRKENKAFMILSALGILFVVDVHLGSPLGVLTRIFPYDSFFMPMFTFISGYFFRERNCNSWRSVWDYGLRKVRKLLLPYLGWMVFYSCFNELLYRAGIWQIHGASLRELIYGVVTSGVVFAFNSPAWFAPTLFCVSCSYCLLRKLFRKGWQDEIAMVLLATLGGIAVWLSGTAFNSPLHYTLLKTAFFLEFYHLGVWFHNRLETGFDRLPTGTVCLGAMLCNLVLIGRYGSAVEFPVCSTMSGFQSGNPLLPLLTSVTGIAFWVKIAKCLAPVVGQNPMVNFISDHTFWIMTHHIGGKHLFIALCALCGATGIDFDQFLSDGLYLYNSHLWCAPATLLFTMAVLVLGGKIWDRIKKLLLKRCFHMRTP